MILNFLHLPFLVASFVRRAKDARASSVAMASSVCVSMRTGDCTRKVVLKQVCFLEAGTRTCEIFALSRTSSGAGNRLSCIHSRCPPKCVYIYNPETHPDYCPIVSPTCRLRCDFAIPRVANARAMQADVLWVDQVLADKRCVT